MSKRFIFDPAFITSSGKCLADANVMTYVLDCPAEEVERLSACSAEDYDNPFPSPIQRDGKTCWRIHDVLRWWLRRNDETVLRIMKTVREMAFHQAKIEMDAVPTDPVLKKAREVLTVPPEDDDERSDKYMEIIVEMLNEFTGLYSRLGFCDWIAEVMWSDDDDECEDGDEDL